MASADYPRDAVSQLPSSNDPVADAGAMLRRSLDRLASRRNARQVWNALAHALAWGAGAAALLMLAHRFYLVDAEWWAPVAIIVAALVIGWRNGTLRRAGAFDAALDADRALGLQERLSSAIAFAQPDVVRRARSPQAGKNWLLRARAMLFPRADYYTAAAATPTQLVPALVQDAAARANGLDPKQVYPLRLDRATKLLAAAVLALAVFSLMPNIDWLRSSEQRALALTLNREGKELEAVAKQVNEKKDVKEQDEAKKMAKRLSALGKKMQRGRMTKKEALVSMGQLRKDMEKSLRSEQQNNGGMANLEQVEQALRQETMQSQMGQEMQEELAKRDYQKAAEKLESLADKIEKGELSQQEKQKAADDLEKAAKALRDAGNEDAAKSLEEAAKQLRGQNQQNQKGQQGNQQQAGQQGNQQQKGGQKPGQQGQQGGQQGQQGGQQQGQQSGGQGAGALRNLAKSLRASGSMGNGQALRNMLKKIEQAERNSGQQAGACPGGNCSGDGDKPGKGSSGKVRVSDPRGIVGGGAGLGPRNNAQGVGKGGGVSKLRSGKRNGDKRLWAGVWSDRLPATRKKIDRVTGKMGDSGEAEQLPTRTEAKSGPVNTPYYDVYESYKKDAEDAVTKEVVPPAYKQPVKDYFDSLEPK